MEFKLGSKVRDRITGFTGFATARSQLISGMVQYTLSPSVTEDKPEVLPEVKGMDYNTLELIAEPGIEPVEPIESSIMPGFEVRDLITKHKGIVTNKIWFINGCIYYDIIVTSKNESKELEPRLVLPHDRVEYIGHGLVKVEPVNSAGKLAGDVEPETKPIKSPGGPVTRGYSIR